MTPEAPAKQPGDWLSRLEWLVSGSILLSVLFLGAVFTQHAGGFWRDEANSVQLATWPGFRPNWDAVWLDAHPVGYSLLLKPLVALSGGQPAGWLRWAGVGIYLLITGTLWALCRRYSGRVPLFFFAAIVLNPLSIRFLSSLRPYGLVTWFLLLCLLAGGHYARRGGRLALVGVGITALLCVQCLYASTIPVLCIVLGMTWVSWRNQGHRAALNLAMAGLAGAGTVLIYLPGLVKARYWADLQSYKTPQLAPFWGGFVDLLQSGGTLLIWMWALGFLFGFILYLGRPKRNTDADSRLRMALLPITYAALAGVIGLLVLGRTFTAQWYFLPALVLVAAALEINFSHEVQSRRSRWLYLMLTLLFCAIQIAPTSRVVHIRYTNVDLVARQVEAEAIPGDFVLVANPLHGVSFNLYYHGKAAWDTVPPLKDHRIHRFDLIRDQMNNPGALEPLYRQIETALQSGHRVFLVGGIRAHSAASPDPAKVIDIDAYLSRWHTQLAFFLQEHAGGAQYRAVELQDPISPLESDDLIVVQGWR